MTSFRSVLPALGLATALTVLLAPFSRAQEPRLANISTRAFSGTGADVLTAGFVIGPGANKQVLVRAIGPTLTGFGVAGALADPVLTLFNSANTAIASNDNWLAADAATFASVGAFALGANSRDSALVATLAPGNYTAQIAGSGSTTGLALVEVYEVGVTGAKLINTSTRLQISPSSAPIIGFVVSPGSGNRRLLLRAAGPALAALGLTGTLANPSLSLTTSAGTIIATNDNWSTPVTVTASVPAATATTLAAAFTSAGAFNFPASSADAALLVDLAPGNYGIQATGVGATSGLALVEVYDVTPAAPAGPPTITLVASKSSTDESGANSGEFTVTRTGETLTALTVQFGVAGTATNGFDYPPLLGTVIIPAGASSAKIALQPFPDTLVEPTETVILTLAAASTYTLGAATTATVSITDNPGTLYVANLRPAAAATGSGASGLATIVLSASGTLATVNVAFSNLSSGQAGAHLFLGNSTSSGDYVLNLPLGQVSGAQWVITPTATYTAAQILSALTNGLIYVGLDTGNHPTGELRGAFLTAVGSQTFTAPAAAPAVSLTNVSATDAARFLTQATFGPKKSEVDALTGGSIDAWITAQMALPASSQRTAGLAEWAASKVDAAAVGTDPNSVQYFPAFRRRAWFPVALASPDQLRQRVAFALSQILVISDTTLANALTEGLSLYWDQLAAGAFGNYRTLLEQATLSPVMGTYLSHLRNAKADPVTGTNPDENYARELMQLFTIGLVQLQPDGTLKLDGQGLPIPTYNQTTITETAKILTGFGFFTPTPTTANFRTTRQDYINPMILYAGHHESAQKTIVSSTSASGTVIPANLGGTEDLKRLLDTLFNHTNTPSFVCRQLIQRLVTDNPSPAYVYRVAQKFIDNGSGVRGDLGAVVRAILTDYEARSPAAAAAPGYGKLREPLLRFTALLRGFNATSSSGRNALEGLANSTFQAAQQAPSVFNFFEPGYVYPGALAAAGLVAPEFQITDATSAITVPNLLYNYTVSPLAATNRLFNTTYALDLTAETALATDVSALLDRLNLHMCANQMSSATKSRLTTALNALPASTTALDKVRNAVYLVATTPDGAIQK